jgi:AraC-like DNA-binding protein
MNESINHLDLSMSEKKKLRANKIRLKEVHHLSLGEIQRIMNIPKIRAMELKALSEFQGVPSIGIRFAHDLISLGFYSLVDLRRKDPAKLVDRFERQLGAWVDPCVEDQFRLVVKYANDPTSSGNWWDFTSERKTFRQKHGYPSSRPKKPWYELDQYKKSNRINAKTEVAKTDLEAKLKLAWNFMKKNLHCEITLPLLADISTLSPFHFHRLFKETYEMTPLQYLTHLRMKEACRLLEKTGKPISLITSMCGFEDQSSFARLFKKEFKKTPLEFRHLFANKNQIENIIKKEGLFMTNTYLESVKKNKFLRSRPRKATLSDTVSLKNI